MPDYSPPRRQIWITRAHLAALGVATTAIAALAFMLGLEVGLRRRPPPEGSPAGEPAFLPDASDEETLEALLREVERAQAELEQEQSATHDANASFTAELTGAEAPGAPEPRPPATASTEVPAGPDANPEPPATPLSEGAPTHGWAIQVAAYEDQAQADAEVERLSGQGYAAYRTAALVAGRTWHRVRIGGYDSREDAEAARETLQQQLDVTDLIVARAP